jgi:hypothetical protein
MSARRDISLLQLLTVLCFGLGNAVAGEVIGVDVPPECAVESRAPDVAYPFIDRIGDPRFVPRPLATAADAVTIVQPDLDDLLVSAAVMADRETLLITTYHDILSLNIHTGKVTRLVPDLGSLNNTKYVPTGIAIGRRTGSVFLANYLANDILIGHVRANRVVFEQELSGDGLVSPENVAATPDESWLVSANFDGSTATAFTLVGDRYVPKWKTQVPSAHGVAILGDRVFVSSLLLRKIIVLDLNDGHEIGSFGQPGWNTRCLDFLWPTGIEVAENKVIVISDAHTGGIYRIAFDGSAGKLIDVIGGTAPGPGGLQMPYAAISIGDDLAILSTFSPKLLIIGPTQPNAPPTIKTLIVQQAHQTAQRSDRDPSPPLGVGWNGYVHLASASMTISGFQTVPSYGALTRVAQDRTLKTDGSFELAADTLRLFLWSMYFIEAHAVQKGAVLSSPSAPYALYVTRGPTSCFTKVDLPGAALASDSGLEHKFGITGYDEVERQASARLRELDSRREPDDFLPISAIAEALRLPPDKLNEAIKTGAGKDTLAVLVRCDEQLCSSEARKAAVDRYKAQLEAPSETSLFELLLLDMSVHRCAA